MALGLAFDVDGNLLSCEGADFGGCRVTKTDMSSGKSTIVAGLFNDKRFNSPNDLVIDNNGRIYFTDPRYFGKEPIDQPLDGVSLSNTEDWDNMFNFLKERVVLMQKVFKGSVSRLRK